MFGRLGRYGGFAAWPMPAGTGIGVSCGTALKGALAAVFFSGVFNGLRTVDLVHSAIPAKGTFGVNTNRKG